MTINGQNVGAWFSNACGLVLGYARLVAAVTGALLALAIGVDLKVWDVPHVAASQGEMMLAALLVWAGR